MGETTVTAAILVIGDEVLSGRTRDANTQVLAQMLDEIGIRLRESRAIADDHATIVSAVREMRERVDYLFTSGGIGPTHDDITAEAVAAAFDVPISIRDDARAILEAAYGDQLNEGRLRMARIPDGASLIENPVSAAPGFILGNVHVLAGVPQVFRAMLDAVRPTLQGGSRISSSSISCRFPEGVISGPLGKIAERHPHVSIGSYPRMQPGGGWGVTIVARSIDAEALGAAETQLHEMIAALDAGNAPTSGV